MIDEYKRNEGGKFVKGTRGGPGAKKSGYALADLMRVELDKPDLLIPAMTKNQRIIKTIVDSAIAGDVRCIEIVLNRVYGKELERISIEKGEELDLGKLSDEELVAYNSLLEKVIDSEPDQD